MTLSGYESEEYLQKVAYYINNKMTELGQLPGYSRQSLETKHTLLDLNVADDYFKAKRQAELFEEELETKDRESVSGSAGKCRKRNCIKNGTNGKITKEDRRVGKGTWRAS